MAKATWATSHQPGASSRHETRPVQPPKSQKRAGWVGGRYTHRRGWVHHHWVYPLPGTYLGPTSQAYVKPNLKCCIGATRACVDAIDVEGRCGGCGSCLEATSGCLGECLEGCAECQCCWENGDLNGCGIFFGFLLMVTLLVSFIFSLRQLEYWIFGKKG
ncbi:hypothetical protein FB45DRAFT_1104330 [Roridomyces roridus]|uniref:Uncharacterized protein n=1 Tax=Roridomyces roridus TaxID=1738132 RepID=A0AAD7FGE3_9AGAR|nr:hypothetical protein FB45DRAFT_1104330 [Roridomyces roridus]